MILPSRRESRSKEGSKEAAKCKRVESTEARTGLPPRSATRVEMTLVEVTGGEIQILLIPKGTQILDQILRTACT